MARPLTAIDPLHRGPIHLTPAALGALAALVCRLCGSGTAPGSSNRLPDPWPHLPDALVRKHLIAPLASELGLSRFRTDYIASSLMAEVRERILAEALAALAARAIPVILLKGISYVGTIYQSPSERPMSDIDLMVPPRAHAEAARTLRRLGYWSAGSREQASSLHHAVCLRRKDAAIDLHRSIMQPLRSRIDIDALWRRARQAAERTEPALRLHPVDEAVLHLAHVARHELRVPVINYVDAARLLTRAPEDEVMDRARAFRLGRAVQAAMTMTHALAQGHDPAWSILPARDEILAYGPVGRPIQLVRKALLVEGPLELMGLVVAGAHGMMAHRFRS